MESPRKRARSLNDPPTPGTSVSQRGTRSLLPTNLNITFEDSELSSTSRSTSTYSDTYSDAYTNYTQEYETFFESVGRIKLKGKLWELYKPVNEDSLYYEILQQPKNTKEIAIDLLNKWEKGPLTVIQNLVQLFVNLCGFKEFVAPDIYNMNNFQEYTKAIMEELCKDESSDIIRNNRCLFNEKFEGTVQILLMGVYNFIFNFIVLAFKKGILSPDDDDLTTSLQTFLKVMSKQRMRQIVHTGIIISNKILSSLIMTYNLITNEYKFRPNESNAEEALLEGKRFLMLLINNFYLNFRNIYYSGLIPYAGKNMSQLKVECIRECKFWMKTHPRIFICNWEILKILNFYLHDASKHVRLAALHTLNEVFKCPEALQYITSDDMKVLIEKIRGRFDDVAIEVSTKAFRVIETIILCRHELISHEVVDEFSKLIFCQSAPDGIEAAKLYTTYLKVVFNSKSVPMSEDNYFLCNIVNIYRNQEQGNAKEYLIESFLRGWDQQFNFDSFLDLFNKIRDEDKDNIFVLSEIFAEFICQFLKGKTNVKRIGSETYPTAGQKVHQKIVSLFRDFIEIIVYHQTPKISSELFKVVTLIDYNCLDADNYPLRELERMLHAAFNCFKTYEEPKMVCLSKAAEVILVLKSLDRVKRYADSLLPDLIEETVDSAKSYLKNPVVEKNFLLSKLAALFKHFDLTNYFTIDELIEPFENLYDLHSVVGLANSCADYLKWKLKAAESILRSGNRNHAIYSLKSMCERVLDALFRLLNDEHLLNPVKYEVFFIICEFFTSFNAKIIEIATAKAKLFLMLKLSIEDDVWKNEILWNYVEQNVVFNVDMPLQERRKHLKSYIRLIEKNILSSECWTNVLKLYSTHSQEFGGIVEWIFQSFIDADSKNSNHNTVLILFLTLFNIYENILNVNGSVDFGSEEGNDLKRLSEKFASYQPLFNKREIIITKFLEMLSLKNDVKMVPMVYLLKPFLNNITDETTRNLFQKFGGFIRRHSKLDCIVWLKTLLKAK